MPRKVDDHLLENDVRNHLMENNNICVNVSLIRKILKSKLLFSFKRCSTRPITLNWKILKLKKILFLVRLSKMINRQSILTNVDESVFSRSTKANYSWPRKGEPSNLSKLFLVDQSASWALFSQTELPLQGLG